uniref:Uncharacterized protein n=1 Tax=Anopheles epiroticus TaxID=199890 RepID=A0A182PX01_9DIPT
MLTLQQPALSREWMCPILLEKENQASRLIESILQEELDNTIINFMRLSRTDFSYLLQQIAPNIQKADTNMRKSLSAKDKLIISAQAIDKFIPEVCCCIVEVLKDFVKSYLQLQTIGW